MFMGFKKLGLTDKTEGMKETFMACCIAALALISLSCTPQTTLEVCVSSPDGERQFELAVGGNITVSDIAQPIEVSAVSWGNKELVFQK